MKLIKLYFIFLVLISMLSLGCAWRTECVSLDSLVRKAQARIEEVRGLKFKKDVPIVRLSGEEIRNYVLKGFNMRGEEAVEKTFKAFGFFPEDFNMRDVLGRTVAERVDGFYDTRGKRVILKKGLGEEEAEQILEHELVHALQDQHFDIRTGLEIGNVNRDAALAYRAVLEGDAVSTQNGGIGDVGDLSGILKGVGRLESDDPAVIRALFLFPYTAGLIWVFESGAKGGYEGVNRALAAGPDRIASTEQIIHPEKYFGKREKPVEISLPDLSGVLRGYRPLEENNLGELFILSLLSWEPENAIGWAGDRYRSYEDDTGRVAVGWYTTWESEACAGEFFRQCVFFGRGMKKAKETAARVLYFREDASVLVERRGRDVVVVLGAPRASAAGAAEKMWSGVKKGMDSR